MGASGQQHLHNVICNIASQLCAPHSAPGHNVIHKMARTSCGCTHTVDAHCTLHKLWMHTHCAMLPADEQNEWVYFV